MIDDADGPEPAKDSPTLDMTKMDQVVEMILGEAIDRFICGPLFMQVVDAITTKMTATLAQNVESTMKSWFREFKNELMKELKEDPKLKWTKTLQELQMKPAEAHKTDEANVQAAEPSRV